MNIAIRYDKGLGSMAVYARLLGPSGFWDFVNSEWDATETAPCRAFLAELADSSTVTSWYQSTIAPPVYGPYSVEYVDLATGDVVGNDLAWGRDEDAEEVESETAQNIQFLLSQVRASGVVLSLGKVYFYAAGTSTLKTIWLDRNKTAIAANPYTLGPNGTAQLYADGVYRVVIKDSSGVTRYDYDYLKFSDRDSDISELQSAFDAKLLKDVSDYDDLPTAVAAIGNTPTTLCFRTDQTLNAPLATPATLELLPLDGAVLWIGGNAVNYAGSTARWPMAQVFNGTGVVTFGASVPEVYPVWWGAAHDALSTTALQAAAASGKPVLVPEGATYLAKNIALTTPNQIITVNGTLKLPNACADNDAILTATGIDGIKVVGRGAFDGNKAGQSGAISQQLIRFTTVTNCFIGGGLTFKKNYSGAVSAYGAVYVSGSGNKLDLASLLDWSKEGIYFDDVSYSSVCNVHAADADGDSWSAVQVGGATAVHNRISGVTAKNTGASAVGLDSQYSVMENITVDGVRFQNGVNFGHAGKPASYSTGSNIVVKNLTDSVNATSAGLSIVNGTTDVSINNFTCDGSTKRGVNISAGATNVNLTNITLRNCVTALSMYQAGRVSVKNLSLSGTITTGISKDEAAGGSYTTLILDTADITAATTRISGAAAGLASPYMQYRSTMFDNTEAVDGSTSVAALGAGGTTTITNANARANSRIILEASNTAGAAALPFIQTQSDGSFVIQTVNNGAGGAFVRWKIL